MMATMTLLQMPPIGIPADSHTISPNITNEQIVNESNALWISSRDKAKWDGGNEKVARANGTMPFGFLPFFTRTLLKPTSEVY